MIIPIFTINRQRINLESCTFHHIVNNWVVFDQSTNKRLKNRLFRWWIGGHQQLLTFIQIKEGEINLCFSLNNYHFNLSGHFLSKILFSPEQHLLKSWNFYDRSTILSAKQISGWSLIVTEKTKKHNQKSVETKKWSKCMFR
jgi:hypothetical protein